jgi:hypothetical protein
MKYPASGLFLVIVLGACSTEPDRSESVTGNRSANDAVAMPAAEPDQLPGNASATANPPLPQPDLIGQNIARAEWAKAANRADCAPLGLVSDGGANGMGRRANFSGGWAVAFDQPGLRSAYGFAGTGLLPSDNIAHDQRLAELHKQWPYWWTADGGGLPQGSAAGFGLEGARRYANSNPDGKGEQSLAYLRVPGQRCTYNVWSRISRAHLESLLDNLRILEP